MERLRPLAEAYVKRLQYDFEASDDDGGLFHDWQDAKRILNSEDETIGDNGNMLTVPPAAAKEIERLRALVKEAYNEGYHSGVGADESDFPISDWEDSSAREEL